MLQPLRKPTPEDVVALAQLFANPAARQFLGGPVALEQAHASALELAAAHREFPAWVITEPGSPHPVGFVCLERHHDGIDVEVSFALLPEYQGRGLGRAAVGAALRQAWSDCGLSRVVAETQSAHKRSVRLLKSLGFVAARQLERFGAQQTVFELRRPGGNAA